MKRNYRNTITAIILTSVSGIIPNTTYAATARAMLEKSANYALNNSIYGFRVPTIDSFGTIKYYDVTVNLSVNPNGTIKNTATVASKASILVGTANIVAGTYQATGGPETCVVTNLKLNNGRTQSFFKCDQAPSRLPFEFSVVTGNVAAGHPFLAQLQAKKVNTRTDVNTQHWGVGTAGNYFHIGGCSFSGLSGTALGATTDGNQIAISVINNAKFPDTYCVPTMTRIP